MFKVVKDVASTLKLATKEDQKLVVDFVQDVLKKVEGVAKVPMLLFCQDHAFFAKQFIQVSEELYDILANNLNE